MEDLHRRSINMSRAIAGTEAWRESDCDGAGLLPMQDAEDWNPVTQAYPSQPDWDTRSINDSRMSVTPGTPGTPGQWSHDTLAPGSDPYLAAPRLNHEGRRGSFETTDGNDYFSSRSATDSPQEGYNHFLDKANRAIARDQKHAPDPFLDPNAALTAPHRPFGSHSRVSSVESIASIVDEKVNSPLNKAIASVRKRFPNMILTLCIDPGLIILQFTDSDGGVASEFVQKLQMLSADNSKNELCIEKYLIKSEEAFFGKVRKEKLDSAASIRSSQRDSIWGTPTPSIYSRPGCT